MTPTPDEAQRLLDALLADANTAALPPDVLTARLKAVQRVLQAAPESAAPTPDATETALREQSAFFGHALHELRTPMTSVRGYTDMLVSMGGLNDMQKGFVETVRVNVRRMEALMQDVSDINKLRAGTLRLNPRIDTMRNIAQQSEKAMTPLAQQLGRTLRFDLPQGLPLLNLDGDVLVRALNKLIENGLRYHEGTGGECVVSAVADGASVVLTVRDDGIGIAPEDLAQLGTTYFRSENELVRTYKGSGLGVPVAMGIARVLGSSLHFASTPGAGTTVTLRLPGTT
jgi:signal transduction histidine kinase